MPHAALTATELPADLPYTFSDLPLRDFVQRRTAQGAVFLLRRPDAPSSECLAHAGMDMLVETAECVISDGMLWSYSRSKQLQLAHDTSLCLDVFGPHNGNDLGVYWCHGMCGASEAQGPRHSRTPDPWCHVRTCVLSQVGSTSSFNGVANRPSSARVASAHTRWSCATRSGLRVSRRLQPAHRRACQIRRLRRRVVPSGRSRASASSTRAT